VFPNTNSLTKLLLMERQRKKTMKYFHMLQGVFQLMSKLLIYREMLMSWMMSLEDAKYSTSQCEYINYGGFQIFDKYSCQIFDKYGYQISTFVASKSFTKER